MNEEHSQITQQKAKQNPELGTGQQFFQENEGGQILYRLGGMEINNKASQEGVWSFFRRTGGGPNCLHNLKRGVKNSIKFVKMSSTSFPKVINDPSLRVKTLIHDTK